MTEAPLLVLIGPAATGKTTLGRAVAARSGRSFVDLDAAAAPYYAEAGWSIDRLRERVRAVGRVAAEREWEQARAHAVECVIGEGPGAVIALGAGHTCYTERRHAERVRRVLRRCPRVVLLLPSPDPAEALPVLRRRSLAAKGTDWITDGHDFLAQWLHDPGTRALATHLFCTGAETPAQSADRLTALALSESAPGPGPAPATPPGARFGPPATSIERQPGPRPAD